MHYALVLLSTEGSPVGRSNDEPKPNRDIRIVILFFALLFVAIAIAGATAFVIFWPLTLVHIRDRHPALQTALGAGAFANPAALGWLLCRRYRAFNDRNLNGLATPAFLSLITIIAGLVLAGLLWLLSTVVSW